MFLTYITFVMALPCVLLHSAPFGCLKGRTHVYSMCVRVRSRYSKYIAVCVLSKHFNAVAALDLKSMLEQIDV